MKDYILTIIRGTPVLFVYALRIATVLNITILLIIAGIQAYDRKGRAK